VALKQAKGNKTWNKFYLYNLYLCIKSLDLQKPMKKPEIKK